MRNFYSITCHTYTHHNVAIEIITLHDLIRIYTSYVTLSGPMDGRVSAGHHRLVQAAPLPRPHRHRRAHHWVL